MKHIIPIIVILVTLSTTQSQAAYVDGAYFYNLSRDYLSSIAPPYSNAKTDETFSPDCLTLSGGHSFRAFIMAIADTVDMILFDIPVEVTNGDLCRAVVLFIDENPSCIDQDGYEVVIQAFESKWPIQEPSED